MESFESFILEVKTLTGGVLFLPQYMDDSKIARFALEETYTI